VSLGTFLCGQKEAFEILNEMKPKALKERGKNWTRAAVIFCTWI